MASDKNRTPYAHKNTGTKHSTNTGLCPRNHCIYEPRTTLEMKEEESNCSTAHSTEKCQIFS